MRTAAPMEASITVGAIEPQFYALLLEKLGLKDDPDFAKQWVRSRWPMLKQRLQAARLFMLLYARAP
jgi:crotonobetainyl-CoA:carnitine CoA-transferase CaiB-like acyl-CoA transferase